MRSPPVGRFATRGQLGLRDAPASLAAAHSQSMTDKVPEHRIASERRRLYTRIHRHDATDAAPRKPKVSLCPATRPLHPTPRGTHPLDIPRCQIDGHSASNALSVRDDGRILEEGVCANVVECRLRVDANAALRRRAGTQAVPTIAEHQHVAPEAAVEDCRYWQAMALCVGEEAWSADRARPEGLCSLTMLPAFAWRKRTVGRLLVASPSSPLFFSFSLDSVWHMR